MSQHDFVIADQGMPAARADLNAGLQALASTSKGPAAPSTPYAGQLWLDDDTPSATVWTLNLYDGTDWIALGQLDTTTNKFTPTNGVRTDTTPNFTVAINEAAYVDVASAATTDIAAAASNNVRITGTTTITSLGTAAAGVTRRVRFQGALTLTYNATSLILPGAANITTAADDCAEFTSLGSGNWFCTRYERKSGNALVGPQVLQVVDATYATYTTTTAIIPYDDTIPQNTEGLEIIAQSFTPKNASSTIYFEWTVHCSITSNNNGASALFVDSVANALAAVCGDPIDTGGAANALLTMVGMHSTVSGSTTARTYRVRAGPDGGTLHINGDAIAAARRFGGVLVSRLRIMEVL